MEDIKEHPKNKISQLGVIKLLPYGLKASRENRGIRLATNKTVSQSPMSYHICLVSLLLNVLMWDWRIENPSSQAPSQPRPPQRTEEAKITQDAAKGNPLQNT